MSESKVKYPADFTQFVLDCGVNPTWPQMTYQEIMSCSGQKESGAKLLQAWFANPDNFGGNCCYTVSIEDCKALIDQYSTNLSLRDLDNICKASNVGSPEAYGPGDY